ncbi:MAG: protein-L-isoaspartate(D-aspartate) O-methyltransferase [Roseiflexus sp.]|jgi:protein-L-isoaspartate(D-aspartate) O-methyltransferase|nr:protein-L-isoaspartate(D-aspartate) O-methyltransferase [Roseiflexus sp.]MBO9366474.1 protein-L-isoaspartate(D-aspartate) O-methyltransferase [Roseiflexus sp.]MBO9381454.1 protein-L-isoaspartate(D-aspartate) O-methyltransferase [Roseiflexus sp.]MBO9387680.1 protein-L-isoaspartate(D-aspartate) O-methyltransferase [Roseiflexus sp.]
MDFANERRAMVDLLVQRGIRDQRVLDAMAQVPRHAFVPENERSLAYSDQALPIGEGQTISQPYMVALMVEALQLAPTDRVLEVGAGSGYAAAVLSRIVTKVHTVECREVLAKRAVALLQALGYANVTVHIGDGTQGLPDYAPFDAILVSAASPWVPAPLREQLASSGRLVIPVGGRQAQILLRLRREGDTLRTERLCDVRFVPLIGGHAWTTERYPER